MNESDEYLIMVTNTYGKFQEFNNNMDNFDIISILLTITLMIIFYNKG
jgi:hypothetical protein